MRATLRAANLWPAVLLVLAGGASVHAQTPSVPLLPGSHLEIVQRFNYTLRRAGRYQGHVQRETRTWLVEDSAGASDAGASSSQAGSREYRGEFMASENTLRDLRTVASRIDERESLRVRFDGTRLVRVSGPVVWQALPTVPTDSRDGWEAPAVARVQLPDGAIRSLPVNVAYHRRGTETFQGQSAVRIDFGYSLRWPLNEVELEEHPAAGLFNRDDLPSWDIEIRGSHQGTLLLPVGGGVPLLHRTDLREQIRVPGAEAEERAGFVLTWYHSTPPAARSRVQEPDIPDVTVDTDELDRVRISIRNLQFVANEAELLPGDAGRLDAIAELLLQAGESTILVTGHTADVGSVESQIELSIARARRISEALIQRGVPPGRLRYEGRGGSEPVGDNATPEGRARNRRVELRLLPDG